jgi:undecaprenyl-diphosphatase
VASDTRTGGAAAAVTAARRDPIRPVVVAGTLVVLALVWAAAIDLRSIHTAPGIPLDAAWKSAIHAVRTHPMVAVAQIFAWLGAAPGSFIVAVVIAGLMWWRRGIRVGLVFVVALLLSEANVNLMKAVDLRPRPNGGLWGGIGSFPSGHTAFAAVLAATFGMLLQRAWVWIAGFAWVAAMALSRTVIDAHWLTDTFAGAAGGAALTVLVWSLAGPRSRRRSAEPAAAE